MNKKKVIHIAFIVFAITMLSSINLSADFSLINMAIGDTSGSSGSGGSDGSREDEQSQYFLKEKKLIAFSKSTKIVVGVDTTTNPHTTIYRDTTFGARDCIPAFDFICDKRLIKLKP